MKKEREKERKRYFKSLTKICFDLESNKNQNLNNFSITLKKRDETKQINLIFRGYCTNESNIQYSYLFDYEKILINIYMLSFIVS